jgi:hypothetical protein
VAKKKRDVPPSTNVGSSSFLAPPPGTTTKGGGGLLAPPPSNSSFDFPVATSKPITNASAGNVSDLTNSFGSLDFSRYKRQNTILFYVDFMITIPMYSFFAVTHLQPSTTLNLKRPIKARQQAPTLRIY